MIKGDLSQVYDFLNKRMSSYSNSYIEGILAKGEDKNWHIYFLRIIFSDNPTIHEELLREVDEKAIAFRLKSTADFGRSFLLSAGEKTKYYIPANGINEKFSSISRLDIVSELKFLYQQDMSYQIAKLTGLENPNEAIFLATQEPVNIFDSAHRLSRYQHLNGLAKNVLKIDLQRWNGYQHNVFIAFEKNSGKITSINKSGSGISIHLDYDSNQKDYALYIYANDGTERELEINTQVDDPHQKNPGFEIRLLKNEKVVDSYKDWEDASYPFLPQNSTEVQNYKKNTQFEPDFDLHPQIIDVSKEYFSSEHYEQAYVEALKKINNIVKEKSKREDLDGKKLMTTVFSPNSPILKLNSLITPTDIAEQEGYMYLFAGAMEGLRNPPSHRNAIKIPKSKALKYLALASLLLEKLDESKRLGK